MNYKQKRNICTIKVTNIISTLFYFIFTYSNLFLSLLPNQNFLVLLGIL